MRMYLPKHSAELPSSTCSPATEQEGASTVVNVNCCDGGTFACFCFAAICCCAAWIALTSGPIPLGVMSGVPTMNSCWRLSLTVLPPLIPSTTAATPNAIRTTPAAMPPISSAFFTLISSVVGHFLDVWPRRVYSEDPRRPGPPNVAAVATLLLHPPAGRKALREGGRSR